MIIIWELPDKSIAVTNLVSNVDVNEEISKISADRPEFMFKFTIDTNTEEVAKMSQFKLDEFFKSVEIDDTNNFVYNIVKAKNIWKDKIRKDRYKKLLELDVEYQRALENNDTVKMAEVANKKQILRDAPNNPAIDAATTLEELREVYPDILK